MMDRHPGTLLMKNLINTNAITSYNAMVKELVLNGDGAEELQDLLKIILTLLMRSHTETDALQESKIQTLKTRTISVMEKENALMTDIARVMQDDPKSR